MPLGAALKRALHPACRQRGGIEWGGSSLFGSSLVLYAGAGTDIFLSCRIPSDHIPIRSWPLFLARELMRDLIETLKAEQST